MAYSKFRSWQTAAIRGAEILAWRTSACGWKAAIEFYLIGHFLRIKSELLQFIPAETVSGSRATEPYPRVSVALHSYPHDSGPGH